MFTFTCPKCKIQINSQNIQSGAVKQCKNCDQRMRVVVAEDSANAGAAITQPSGRSYGPILLGAGALLGIVIGGGIHFRTSLFGPKPSTGDQTNDALVQGSNQAGPSKADTGKKDENNAKANDTLKAEPRILSNEEVYQEMLKSCVWILASDGKETWTGSGSLIDRESKLILTNQHVANRRCTDIVVVFPIFRDGKLVTERELYLANLKKKNPENVCSAGFVDDRAICDLALIRVKGRLPRGSKALQLSKRKITPGHQLHTVGGSPKGNSGVWIYSSGLVRQIGKKPWNYGDGKEREGEVIASTVPINPGDSGGAVVDSRGFLVGVNAMSSAGVLNVGHISVNEVRDFLTDAYRQKLGKEFKEQHSGDEAGGPLLADRVNRLIKELQAPTAKLRTQAAKDLGDIGPDAQIAAIPLLDVVRSTEVLGFRQAAITALKEIGPPKEEHFNRLLAALEDKKCTEGRRYAALNLGSVSEENRKKAIEALKEALKDEDSTVRAKAAFALGTYGPIVHEEAGTELVECLRDNEFQVREQAYQALLAGGVPDDADWSSTRDLLEGAKNGKKPTRQARYWAAFLLVNKFKETGLPQIVAAIEEEENFEDKDFMIFILRQVGEFKFNSPDVGAILSKALDHRKEEVWVSAMGLYSKLNGTTYGDLVKPKENTVEALIKICVIYPKLADWLEKREEKAKGEETKGKEKEKDKFKRLVKEICSTFYKEEGLAFKSTPKLVGTLSKALGESDSLARRVAVNCLERAGKDAANAAPAVADALLKEKEVSLRIEFLAALAAMGKAGAAQLGDNKALPAELDKWINDARGDSDSHLLRVMAALTMASLYPEQTQTDKAYHVLAHALLLTNAPITLDANQRMRFGLGQVRQLVRGGRMLPNVRQPAQERKRSEAKELELHERAKQTLSVGGLMAADATYSVFKNNFWSKSKTETEDIICDKIHARLCAFQVLAKIGPQITKSKELSRGIKAQIKYDLGLNELGKEYPAVVDAARNANRVIFGK